LRSSPPAPCPLNLRCCPASSKNRGMARENREREREPRENSYERTAERELGMQEGKPNEGKPRGMRGMTGEFEKPNEGNDRGMRGNQMTVE